MGVFTLTGLQRTIQSCVYIIHSRTSANASIKTFYIISERRSTSVQVKYQRVRMVPLILSSWKVPCVLSHG